MLQCVAALVYSTHTCVNMYSSVLQCVAVCCSGLQCVAALVYSKYIYVNVYSSVL